MAFFLNDTEDTDGESEEDALGSPEDEQDGDSCDPYDAYMDRLDCEDGQGFPVGHSPS